jgi:hypothetical protein
MKDTGYFSVDACEVSVHVGATARRDPGNKILLRYAEATGSKFHVRPSIAWCCALAPINNASPNSEMALLERFELLCGKEMPHRQETWNKHKCGLLAKPIGLSLFVPLLARNRHDRPGRLCPVSGVERKSDIGAVKSVDDPKRSSPFFPHMCKNQDHSSVDGN